MAQINHLAVVVEDIQAALAFWHDALDLPLGKVERSDVEEVDIAFLPMGDTQIELLAPINQTSGIAKYLTKRGPGMHHLCIEVENVAAAMQRLKAHGVELINDAPKVNADGTKYCFVHPKSAFGVLVELYEQPAK